MAVPSGVVKALAKDAQVDGHVRVHELDSLTVNRQPLWTNRGVEDGQSPPQGAPTVGITRLWPEEGGEPVTAGWLGGDGEIGQERDSLSRVDGERATVDEDLDGPQQPDRQAGRPQARDGPAGIARTARGSAPSTGSHTVTIRRPLGFP